MFGYIKTSHPNTFVKVERIAGSHERGRETAEAHGRRVSVRGAPLFGAFGATGSERTAVVEAAKRAEGSVFDRLKGGARLPHGGHRFSGGNV